MCVQHFENMMLLGSGAMKIIKKGMTLEILS